MGVVRFEIGPRRAAQCSWEDLVQGNNSWLQASSILLELSSSRIDCSRCNRSWWSGSGKRMILGFVLPMPFWKIRGISKTNLNACLSTIENWRGFDLILYWRYLFRAGIFLSLFKLFIRISGQTNSKKEWHVKTLVLHKAILDSTWIILLCHYIILLWSLEFYHLLVLFLQTWCFWSSQILVTKTQFNYFCTYKKARILFL